MALPKVDRPIPAMVLTPHANYNSPGQLSPVASTGQPSTSSLPHTASSDSYFPPSGGPPRLRKTSTGSFSKLSEFSLDGPLLDEKERYAPEADAEVPTNSINNVKHVSLSVDASEWRHPVFKQKVLGILRRLVSYPSGEK
ncbi:uncharacterized protein IL334_007084 [Kwoniella shivajii]|uniref:Uncharacterized protein n=1 Tax=Kwoniella shivajii TaxID=564305 RepID=A0ABZ1D7Q1_9TREE|nr:hypothetical protein IL334_007084 [Kwoniella shivajii]